MKNLVFVISALLFNLSLNGQVKFEKSYDMYVNSWTALVFVQDDGYLMAMYGATDKYLMCLVKTDLKGDTVWTKKYDFGEPKYVYVGGTDDDSCNLYLTSGDKDMKLIKFDKNGNQKWVSCISSGKSNLTVKDNILWFTSEAGLDCYLYKVDAITGDSLNRYKVYQYNPDVGGSECTSLVITENNDIVITQTIRHMTNETYSKFSKLTSDSDSIVDFNVQNIPVNFQVMDSKTSHDTIITLAEKTGMYNQTYYLIKYKSDGSLIQFSELNLNNYYTNYDYYMLYKCLITKKNQVVLMGKVEKDDSSQHVLMRCYSMDGDSLWTDLSGKNGVACLDFKTTKDNGFILTGNYRVDNLYKPYLIKVVRRHEVPVDTLNINIPIITNPARGSATFNTTGLTSGTIMISNLYGKNFTEISVTGDNTTWDCSSMEPGLYIYTYVNEKKTYSGKVIVSP